ncbi:hypothetical protein OROMI_002722 [Orobanche minor]
MIMDLYSNFYTKKFGFVNVCANISNHIWIFNDSDSQVVYGRNTKIQRRDLWDDLLSVHQTQIPWMVGGDFNIILQPKEKKGGACPIQLDMEEFSDCLLNCNLSDVGFAGTPFTWYHDGVWQRLDRILVSPEWYTVFPFLSIRHLPKYQSDHNSLICQFNQNISTPKTLFRFQNMWVKHHLFLPTVQESWGIHTFSRGRFKLLEKLSRLKYTLKEWNTYHFGNIFNKIEQAQYAVEVAEKEFDQVPSTSNHIYLNKMNANLTLTLSMEEDFWKQKANMKWMHEGERNNEIDPNLVPNIITQDHNNMLCFTPTIDEIKSCVFDMEGDSVAGPDGFGIKFFSKRLGTILPSFINSAQSGFIKVL